MSKEMKTLTIGGTTYEIVDAQARKDLVANKRDCVAPIIQTAEGSSVTVADSSNRPIRNLRIFGKIEQVVTTGTNLLDSVAESSTLSGVTFTVNDNGGISATGTATATAYLPLSGGYSQTKVPIPDWLVAGETYTITDASIFLYGEDGTTTSFTDKTFVMPEGYDYYGIFIQAAVNKSYNKTYYPRVNAGDTALPWEPYTGLSASPSLDYPQELNNIENLIVTVLGKNLLPYPYSLGSEVGATKTEYGATFMNVGDGGIACYGTPTSYTGVTLSTTFVLKSDISIALLGTYSGVALDVNVYNSAGKTIAGFATKTELTLLKSDYPDGAKLSISLKRRGNNTAISGIAYPMIVAGTELPTEYEPYIESQSMTINRTLSGIGDIHDEIDFERGVYIQRVYTETVTAEQITTIDNTYAATAGAIAYFAPTHQHVFVEDSCSVMSDFALGIASTERGNYPDIYRCYASDASLNYILFRYPVAKGTITYAGAKEDLAGATVSYVLATPIETALTDEELMAFNELYTHKTNTTVLNDSDAYIEIEYSVDLKTYLTTSITSVMEAIENGSY